MKSGLRHTGPQCVEPDCCSEKERRESGEQWGLMGWRPDLNLESCSERSRLCGKNSTI